MEGFVAAYAVGDEVGLPAEGLVEVVVDGVGALGGEVVGIGAVAGVVAVDGDEYLELLAVGNVAAQFLEALAAFGGKSPGIGAEELRGGNGHAYDLAVALEGGGILAVGEFLAELGHGLADGFGLAGADPGIVDVFLEGHGELVDLFGLGGEEGGDRKE